ncbi:hypothetical protein ACP4OV_029639 [Aristida adscensionis]
MDATYGWAGQHVDDYFSRQVGCARLELDEAFLGACFGQLQCDGVAGGDGEAACQVSSNLGADGVATGIDGDPLAFLGSGTGDVFDAGLLDAALAFSKEFGDGDGGAVSNGGAMLSSYSGTTGGNISSGESNNYSGGGGGGCSHDVEVASPTSTMSPATTAPPPALPHASSPHELHPKRKVITDEYHPTITAAAPSAPFPQPGGATKRRAATAATSINFGQGRHAHEPGAAYEPDMEAMAQVKEMIYRAAAMRPVNLGPEVAAAAAAEKPRRKNVRISSDPQTVAARLRRERVSERLRVLQKLVPGGSKMDTASMLDEAASYLKFLKSQVQALETLGTTGSSSSTVTASRPQPINYYGSRSNHGFLGFSRNSNISPAGYVNPNGSNSSTRLL